MEDHIAVESWSLILSDPESRGGAGVHYIYQTELRSWEVLHLHPSSTSHTEEELPTPYKRLQPAALWNETGFCSTNVLLEETFFSFSAFLK